MKASIIGKSAYGNDVYLGTPENLHMCALGTSGAGKSTAAFGLLLKAVNSGMRAIVFNWHSCISNDFLTSELGKSYRSKTRVIKAASGGITLPLFTPWIDDVGGEESELLFATRISNMLSQSANLSDAQKRKVREAVDTIVELNAYSEYGIKALEELLQSEGSSADKAIDKLSPFLTTNLLRDGNFFRSEDQIIEIDLNDFELYDQKVIVEFLLSWLFQYGQKGGFRDRGLVIYIDEAQNLSYKPDSPIYLLLNESRKHNIRVFMAAPSFTAGGKGA